jgi:hypothetical protein
MVGSLGNAGLSTSFYSPASTVDDSAASTVSSTPTGSSTSGISAGSVAGGILGGLAGLAILGFIIAFLLVRIPSPLFSRYDVHLSLPILAPR